MKQLFIALTAIVVVLLFSAPAPPDVQGAPSISVSTISLTTSALIYDETRGLFYASVSSGPISGQLVPIDPQSQSIGAPLPAPAGNVLAISSDGGYLYSGTGPTIRRINLNTNTVDLTFILPDLAWRAEDLEIRPGDDGFVAVSMRRETPTSSHRGVAIFDNGVMLPSVTANSPQTNVLEFLDADTLYGLNVDTSERGFRTMTVSSSGVVIDSVAQNLTRGADFRIVDGLIYGDDGRLFDGGTNEVFGDYAPDVEFTGAMVLPDIPHSRVFVLRDAGSSSTLHVVDLSTYTRLWETSVPEGVGPMFRWGSNGLAYQAASSIVLLQGPAVDAPISFEAPPGPMVELYGLSLDVNATDVAYLQSTGRLYITTDGHQTGYGNRVLVVNPQTGVLEGQFFAGSWPIRVEPSSDDGSLYIGLRGAAALGRLDALGGTLDQYSLGMTPTSGPLFVEDLVPLSSSPSSVAIALRRYGVTNRHQGVAVYDNGTKRPVQTSSSDLANSITEGVPGTLYGYDGESSAYGLRTMAISPSGVSINSVFIGVPLAQDHIEFSDGLIYTDSGQVRSPPSMGLVQWLLDVHGPVVADPQKSRIYAATHDGITVYSTDTWSPLGELAVPPYGTRMVRWGDHGLAYLREGVVHIVVSPHLVSPDDTDGDNVFDFEDNCPLIQNTLQSDVDADGVGDACDYCPDEPGPVDGFGCPNPPVGGSIEVRTSVRGSSGVDLAIGALASVLLVGAAGGVMWRRRKVEE